MKSLHSKNVVTPTYQNYFYNKEQITIIKPEIGSILYRSTKDEKNIQKFIVFTTSCKKNGKNKGVQDRIVLYEVINIERGVANFRQESEMILYLTNHGEWWTNDLLKTYKFSWNKLRSKTV